MESKFDIVMLFIGVLCVSAGLVAYWIPGGNPEAFQLINLGFGASIGFFLGKHSDKDI